MVTLARQLIERQSARYEPADFEDRYETRLRAMTDAKLKGEGVHAEADQSEDRGNVVNLMAALKKSLGQTETARPVVTAKAAGRAAKKIEPAPKKAASQSAAKSVRKRA